MSNSLEKKLCLKVQNYFFETEIILIGKLGNRALETVQSTRIISWVVQQK